MNLSPRHYRMLKEESAIDDAIIQARGYRTVERIDELRALGFSPQQSRNVPGLLIPLYTTDGQNSICVYRPDVPRLVEGKRLRDGTRKQKIIKYEYPKGQPMRLDCPPPCLPHLANPQIPLFITEGQKKADSLASRGLCAIALLGVWNFKGRGSGASLWLPDWDHVALDGRDVFLVFDSDVMTKTQVGRAIRRLAGILTNKGADVTPILLPTAGEGKTGIDDFFAAGHTVEELNALIAHSKTWFEPLLRQYQQAIPKRYDDYIEALARLGYEFRCNDLDDTIEVNGQAIDDLTRLTIRSKMRDAGFSKELSAMEEAYTRYAQEHRYNPIQEYLHSLEWDGESHIRQLCRHFEDTRGVFDVWLRKWLIGAVARVFEPAQNYMLVLDGPQGLGKSHFVAWLGSAQPRYFVEGPIQPDNKDFVIRLANRWIWEVSELGAVIRRADREALKSFITQREIVVRRPYGRYDMQKPAICSFIGTINDEAGFLNDPTGSRRFLVCTLTRIDWRYTRMDVHQVWAEAYQAFRSGETWKLTPDEQATQSSINREYEQEDPIETLLLSRYQIVRPTPDNWIATSDILSTIGLDPKHVGHAKRVGAILRKLGCKRDRGHLPNGQRVNGYCGLAPFDTEEEPPF